MKSQCGGKLILCLLSSSDKMSLNKKTKSQLSDIAEELALDIAECKVKQDIINVIKAHLLENAEDFDEDSKFYETLQVFKLSQPKQPVEEEEEEVEVVEGLDSEVDSEEESEGESDEGSEDSTDYDYSSDDEVEFVFQIGLLDALKEGKLSQYTEYKSLEIRDYLSDPYSINDVAFAIETVLLIQHLIHYTPLINYTPGVVASYLPSFILNIPVSDLSSSINLSSITTLAIWFLVSYVIPNLGSYYLNFTYDFQKDAFTYSLTKLFIASVVFKVDIPEFALLNEVKYNFANLLSTATICQTVTHSYFMGLVTLRSLFGNWIIIEAIFTSVLAFYANLSFI